MATQLRNRNGLSSQREKKEPEQASPSNVSSLLDREESLLSVSRVLRQDDTSGPPSQYAGHILKLHTPLVFSVLPHCLQTIVCNFSCFSFLAPKWKPRFIVLLGKYLYKYINDQPESTPKGSPIPIEMFDFNILDGTTLPISSHDLAIPLSRVPEGFSVILELSSLRKKQYYALKDKHEAQALLHSLNQARHEAIKRSMGHAPMESYPASWVYFDKLGDQLLARKERIRKRIESSSFRELEMTPLSESGGDPAGYFS